MIMGNTIGEDLFKKLTWFIFSLSIIPVVSLASSIVFGAMGIFDSYPFIAVIVSGGVMVGFLSPVIAVATHFVSKKFQNQSQLYRILLFCSLLISGLGTMGLVALLALALLTHR